MIHVVNKRFHTPTEDDVYIGRPSCVGNPFTHISDRRTKAEFVVKSREEAIAKYKPWLREQWKRSSEVRAFIDSLVKEEKAGRTTYLVCWCAPKPCHGNVLKEIIEQMVKDNA